MGTVRRCAFSASLLFITLAITGCGITPYQNPNQREEGPGWGLFTGSEGGWTIYRKRKPAPPSNEEQTATDQDNTAHTSLEVPPPME